MRLVLLKEKMFNERSGFVVGDSKIRALQGYFTISLAELSRVVCFAKGIWKYAFKMAGLNEDFRAHLRLDVVPSFFGEPVEEENGYYLGEMGVKDIYEINAHSPECMSCDALFRENFPEIAKHTPSASRVLASELLKEYPANEVKMVKGSVVTRQSWCGALKRELEEEGLVVKEITQKEAVADQPSVLWRWGNIDFNKEYGEFENGFQEWLLNAQKDINVFNTVLATEDDVASKGLLRKHGEILLNSKENLCLANSFDKNDYVLKPLLGTSGKGIVFGDSVSKERFKEAVDDAYEKGSYGLFKKVLLPKVKVNGRVDDFTLDFLPSFFARGSKLYYLYSVIRMEPWESYIERKTINVLQGGGYGGTVAVC